MTKKPQPLDFEKLAELEHKQWAHWTEYMLENLYLENRERWKVQLRTSYKDLSEKEKESDRDWARKVIKLIKSACEFYLRYKDRPDNLAEEQPQYKKELSKFDYLYCGALLTDLERYNEWLFRLAFKSIFKEVKENE